MPLSYSKTGLLMYFMILLYLSMFIVAFISCDSTCMYLFSDMTYFVNSEILKFSGKV